MFLRTRVPGTCTIAVVLVIERLLALDAYLLLVFDLGNHLERCLPNVGVLGAQ